MPPPAGGDAVLEVKPPTPPGGLPSIPPAGTGPEQRVDNAVTARAEDRKLLCVPGLQLDNAPRLLRREQPSS